MSHSLCELRGMRAPPLYSAHKHTHTKTRPLTRHTDDTESALWRQRLCSFGCGKLHCHASDTQYERIETNARSRSPLLHTHPFMLCVCGVCALPLSLCVSFFTSISLERKDYMDFRCVGVRIRVNMIVNGIRDVKNAEICAMHAFICLCVCVVFV